MAYCGQCGFYNPDGAKFCGGCGAPLTASTSPAAPQMGRAANTPPPPRPYTEQRYTKRLQPQRESGKSGMSCLGCGGIVVFIILAILGVGVWYVYQHQEEITQWMERIEQEGKHTPEELAAMTYNGQLVSDIAEENGFPVVAYDQLPIEYGVYVNDDISARFNFMKFKDNESIAVMTLSERGGGFSKMYKVKPVGRSIYHISLPTDSTADGFLFVYTGAKRILITDKNGKLDLSIPADDDDE